MKNKGLYLFVLAIIAGFSFCTKPDPLTLESLPTNVSIVFPDRQNEDETLPDTVPITYDIIHRSAVAAYLNPELTYDSIADIDGNIYMTIQIGAQTWMAENLKTTRYNDGSAIPHVSDNNFWVTLKTGAYRWYNNDRQTYGNLYGALYNWYTVKTAKLCPVGWHVPSDAEWQRLEMSLGMTQEDAESYGEFPGIIGRGTDQGTRMKAASGWKQWEGKGGSGTNSSGFTALPAGESGWGGSWSVTSSLYTYYYGEGICTTWWDSAHEGGGRAIDCVDPGVIRGIYPAFCGASVRCVRDGQQK